MTSYNKIIIILLCVNLKTCLAQKSLKQAKVNEVFAWKQISYNFDGIIYNKDANVRIEPDGIVFEDDLEDKDKFFIQYNNVPIGLEVHQERVFITVPRRRFGIPSTLNYVRLPSGKAPSLKPYPEARNNQFVSIYRPRVDVCSRLWAVDTGLLEVPGARTQVQQPSIVIFDLKTDRLLLKYELKNSDLVNERTSGGLTSITVDVTADACDDAYAYITDLATEGLVVFSLRQLDSWRLQHQTFAHNEAALNFTVAGNVINWKDGLFSVALSEPAATGSRTAYYHPLVSFNEFSIDTELLKKRSTFLFKDLGFRGVNTQSGSHGYHAGTKTIFYANVAQDAILCWRVDTKMSPENVGIAVQDHAKLVYISGELSAHLLFRLRLKANKLKTLAFGKKDMDIIYYAIELNETFQIYDICDLKVVGDELWVLANQIPRFVFSTLNTNEDNYFVHRANVNDLIKGTPCEKKREHGKVVFGGYK